MDCSGFRSLLLGETLGSPFLGYENSLFTDRAAIAKAPLDQPIQPYTRAQAMEAGWCWSTPQRNEDHRGYVFCSAFLEPETAVEEMLRSNPHLTEPRILKFRPGRRQHFFKGNVVALGNAYGFVEPLESTALHMLIRQIGSLLRILTPGRPGEGLAPLLNQQVGAWWDYLAWFLALHYRFNGGHDSPFWRSCQEEVDVSRHGELLEAFRERGPLSYDPAVRSLFQAPDPLWGAEGIDLILLGQNVPAHLPRPRLSTLPWRRHVAACHSLIAGAPEQIPLLESLERRPENLQAFVEAFRKAGPAFVI